DVTTDAQLGGTRNPVTQTTGKQAVIVIPGIPSVGLNGYVGRRIYRTRAGGAADFRIADLKEVPTPTFLDNVPDDGIAGGDAPQTPSTAGGEAHYLQSIPIGPVGTVARRIYRTTGNGVELHRLVEIPDNVTTTFSDFVPDEQLDAPLVPTFTAAGAAAALLQNVAVGNPSVTKRYIYRTKAGGNAWLYVGSIDNNTETTFTDDKADTDLGRPPVATSTIGALAGDTSVVGKSA